MESLQIREDMIISVYLTLSFEPGALLAPWVCGPWCCFGLVGPDAQNINFHQTTLTPAQLSLKTSLCTKPWKSSLHSSENTTLNQFWMNFYFFLNRFVVLLQSMYESCVNKDGIKLTQWPFVWKMQKCAKSAFTDILVFCLSNWSNLTTFVHSFCVFFTCQLPQIFFSVPTRYLLEWVFLLKENSAEICGRKAKFTIDLSRVKRQQ